MSSKSATLANVLAQGLNGYMRGVQFNEQKARDDEDRAFQRDEREAVATERRRVAASRKTLADAAMPAVVNEGAATLDVSGKPTVYDMPNGADVAGSDYRQARGLADATGGTMPAAPQPTIAVQGKAYGTLADARTAADAYNAPEAVTSRTAQALRTNGDPSAAMTLENASLNQAHTRAKMTAEQAAALKKAKDEGYGAASIAMRAGDPQAVFDTFNKTGTMKLTGVPTVTPREIDVPGLGKIKSYDYTGTLVGPDGQERQGTINSHEFSMSLMQYKDQLELTRKGVDGDNKHQARLQQLDIAATKAEAYGMLAEARALRAQNGGVGKVGEGERKTYTALFTEAGRRMSEAQKARAKLTSGAEALLFNAAIQKNPSGPEAQQLKALDAEIDTYKQDRSLYQGLLADPSSRGKGLADAEPKTPPASAAAAGAPVKVGSKAERDKLPKGARYVGPDGQTYIKQ